MNIDPWILTFSAATVIATVWMGFWSARRSKTASDFFVAGRRVSVGWNASAISGEYLSAASFMGVAGMVMSSGYDALWYPVCYACGYLFLLLFIAGPLRRFGAYTIPDFAEGRFDSPVFRRIAVVFVLFIGFFYTMPQMKGAGTTLAYIFPGLPYWVGVVLVGAVITFNVALGGMKGITIVQAVQYWAKMFAISVPIFVLMAVYGHYGKQLQVQGSSVPSRPPPQLKFVSVFAAAGLPEPTSLERWQAKAGDVKDTLEAAGDRLVGVRHVTGSGAQRMGLRDTLVGLAEQRRKWVLVERSVTNVWLARQVFFSYGTNRGDYEVALEQALNTNGVGLIDSRTALLAVPFERLPELRAIHVEAGIDGLTNETKALGASSVLRRALPAKAPPDEAWLNPFGPLTTKAAKAARPSIRYDGPMVSEPLNSAVVSVGERVGAAIGQPTPRYVATSGRMTVRLALQMLVPEIVPSLGKPEKLRLECAESIRNQELKSLVAIETNLAGASPLYSFKPNDIEAALRKEGITLVQESGGVFRAFPTKDAIITPINPRPYSLLYTYSLIIALVCGTAGLPHILVRFYTNPDGVAAKRTTMWVMILIGVFYLFPPVFGLMGRNLLPSLYEGTGAKGTDKVVLELPRILNPKAGSSREVSEGGEGGEVEKKTGLPSRPSLPSLTSRELPRGPRETRFPWGSILSGITCAGAFAAFMSTFSGLLVSMTGALAHDIYGRILRPKSTPAERMRMFKVCAVIVGAGAMLLGFLVEGFEINKMVGWAFAIAATSYFPLLFLSTWWRGITMKGAATGMLVGGTLSLVAIASTMFADQAAWATGLREYYNDHPLPRILAEQPAIWALPLALGLMFVISKLTAKQVPADIRMKMLVLHAPEKLGLKQEYIQEHQHGH